MVSDSKGSNNTVTFKPSTQAEFLRHLEKNPNRRRICQPEKQNLIDWLCNSHALPSSQKEFSRRNYVKKTFTWDESGQV
ncbi:hypothetical protein B0J18DRAFT_437032, partial [Chaetomium sp. MPI-SDFR-AT-0129]